MGQVVDNCLEVPTSTVEVYEYLSRNVRAGSLLRAAFRHQDVIGVGVEKLDFYILAVKTRWQIEKKCLVLFDNQIKLISVMELSGMVCKDCVLPLSIQVFPNQWNDIKERLDNMMLLDSIAEMIMRGK